MSRLSRVFDDYLKEQVFMLRGDEGYARSTGIVVQLNDEETELSDTTFEQAFDVTVYRDIGASRVCFYANDELVKCVDWDESYSENTLVKVDGLYYNTDYIFKVKYMGNDNCQASSTKNIMVFEEAGQYDAVMTVTENYLFEQNVPLNIEIELSHEDIGLVRNKEILVHVNDEPEFTTLITDDNGKAIYDKSFEEKGAYTLSIVFEGTAMLHPIRINKDISIGYKLITSENKKIVLEGMPETFSVVLTDYLENNVYPNKTIEMFQETVPGEYSKIGEMITNQNGVATYNMLIDSSFDKNISYLYSSPVEYWSGSVEIVYVNPDPLMITKTPEITSKDNPVIINVKTTAIEGIPITLQKTTKSSLITYQIYTDSNGNASFEYVGEGKGNTIISAECGLQHAQIELLDYIQYWTPQQSYNQDFRPINHVQTLQDMFKINLPNAQPTENKLYWFMTNINKDIPFIFKMSGVTFPYSFRFRFLQSDIYADDLQDVAIILDDLQWGTNFNNETIILKRDAHKRMYLQVGTNTEPKLLTEAGTKQFPIFCIQYNDAIDTWFSFKKLEIWEDEG